MKYRYLGNSGLTVSTVCLGTMTFGQKQWGCDEKVSKEILNTYKEQGGNFIDTADIYSETVSEQIIGDWLSSQKRDQMVIATKCFFKTGEDINSRGLSRKHIISACEASLKRLKTDYIDLYQIHGPDPQTPLEETMATLDFLVQQGKVRYIGCSNHPAWKITKASYISQLKGYQSFISGQYLYNLLKRDVEIEVLPAIKDAGMKLICWSPLSGGMLTGKYTKSDKPPKDTRFALRNDVTEKKYQSWIDKSLTTLNIVREIANHYNITPSIVSLAWLLKNELVASVTVGANEAEQIIENCKASEWKIPDKDWNSLNEISQISLGYPREWLETNSRGWFDDIF
jgi:aryl-alcohol dehydrogenase-like predicted oxidoreductase